MKNKKLVGLILAKSQSTRLPRKNRLNFHGRPMFLVNVEKCLKVFDEVYVTSDSHDMLKQAVAIGAKAVWRDEVLCGDTPNIPVYQYVLNKIGEVDGIVAVQSCSPNLDEKILVTVRGLMELGYEEVMTCHPMEHSNNYHEQGNRIYGSVWAISSNKLKRYKDAYKPTPDVLVVDNSEDIEYQEDFDIAIRNYKE